MARSFSGNVSPERCRGYPVHKTGVPRAHRVLLLRLDVNPNKSENVPEGFNAAADIIGFE